MTDKSNKKNRGFRHSARLAAIQALYQIEQTETPAHLIIEEFLEHRLNQGPDKAHDIPVDRDYFCRIVDTTHNRLAEIDTMIVTVLPKDWPLKRIDSVLRAILRAGCGEFLLDPDRAAAIVINEYIKVTKEYYGGKEPGFVNGILDHIARTLNLNMRDQGEKSPPEIENYLKEYETTESATWEDEGGSC